jgi:hypothetical protein
MQSWKVLLVMVFAVGCLALGTATLIVPLGYQGGERWLWLAGLVLATAAAGGLFALLLRYLGRSLDAFPRDSRL